MTEATPRDERPGLLVIMKEFKKSFTKELKDALSWVFKDIQKLTRQSSKEGFGGGKGIWAQMKAY